MVQKAQMRPGIRQKKKETLTLLNNAKPLNDL